MGVEFRRSFRLPAEPSIGHSGVPWALACSPRLPFGSWCHSQGNRLLLRWSNQNISFLRVTLGRESFDVIKCHKPEKTDTSASVTPPSCLTPWDEDPPLPTSPSSHGSHPSYPSSILTVVTGAWKVPQPPLKHWRLFRPKAEELSWCHWGLQRDSGEGSRGPRGSEERVPRWP